MFGALRHRSASSNGASGAASEQDIEMDTININNTGSSSFPADGGGSGGEGSGNNQQSIIDAVKMDILGAPHQGWRQFFYMLDPYKQEQFVRAPKLYDDINIYFSLIYFTFVVVFAVYAFIAYTNQKAIEVNSMVLSSALPPVYVNITTVCSGPHQCGNWTKVSTGGWIEYNGVTLTQTWNQVDSTSPCYGTTSTTSIPDSESYGIIVPICYSRSSVDGVTINIPFTATYSSTASLEIVITSDVTKYTNSLYTTMTMQPNQFKTIFFSQSEYISTSLQKTYDPYAADFFYNGHSASSTTSTNTATLTLRLQQFGYSTTQSYAATILTTFAQIGGFATLWLTITAMFRGVIVMAYKSLFVLKQESSAGLGLNAFQLFCLACCRCAGITPPQ